MYQRLSFFDDQLPARPCSASQPPRMRKLDCDAGACDLLRTLKYFCLAILCQLLCQSSPIWAQSSGISSDELDVVIAAEHQRIQTIKKISAPTLAVFGPNGGGGGSGVIISPDGYALTNYHVTQPCGDYMRCGMNDGKLYDAVIVGIDPTGDVSLIKLLGRDDFPTAELGNSDLLRPGQWCIVAGNPFLLANDFKPTVTYGIISGVHRYQYPSGTLLEYADCIQTDASINPGNSGGPLFNSDGQLVGINGRCSFEKRGRVNVGVGYAISINQIKKFLGYLKSGRIVDHATLGATVGTDDDGRVVVTSILESSDAYRRGLRYEDEVVSLGGIPVQTSNQLKNILGTYPRGWQIPLSFRSDGERRDVLVRLAGVHSPEQLLGMVQKSPVELPEIPQREEKPQDPEPSEPSEPKQKRERQRPGMPGFRPKVKRPEEVEAMIKAKRGYANYYFNQRAVDRIWAANRETGDLSGKSSEWILSADLAQDNQTIEMILRDDEAFANWPEDGYRISLDGDLDAELGPDRASGMALAISMWRRWLVRGPETYGDVYYLGTVPADESGSYDRQNDVLIGTHDATETHFHFHPDLAKLVRVEMYPTVQVDPCELLLSDYINGLPRRIVVKKGDAVLADLKNVSFRIESSTNVE